MNEFRKKYEEKLMSVESCLDTIDSGDRIFLAFYGGEPRKILSHLHEIAPRVKDVQVWKATDMNDYPFLTDPSMDGHIDYCSIFYGKTARQMQDKRRIEYMPNDLHMAMWLKNGFNPCNIFMGTVSPMDENGYFTLGPWVQTERDAMDAADRIILEVNPNTPRTFGDTQIHIDDVDCLVESDIPITEIPELSYTKTEEKIGENIMELVRDGDCIQLGIGGTSNVVAKNLASRRNMGIHSEMFTDSMMELMKKGAVNGSCKNFNPGREVVSFAWGSRDLYDFIDGNSDLEFRRSSYVNDPYNIAKNDNMVSINTCLQVDLTGQVCSESIGPRLYSGTGGAFDFAYGAIHARGGRGIVALPSTAKGGTVSRISAMLSEGAAVSITRNISDHIVTEYGIAYMRGRTIRQRAKQLIEIAHPDFRDLLKREAEYLLLW